MEEWKVVKADYQKSCRQAFHATVDIAERTIHSLTELAGQLPKLSATDPRVQVVPFMVMAAHRRLLNALDLIIAGQVPEAHSVTRPTIEMAGHAFQITRKPELANVWLSKLQDPDRYDDEFEVHFPKDDEAMQRLFSAWKRMSDSGSHSNLMEFSFYYDAEPGARWMRYFPNLNHDLATQQKLLIDFVLTCKEIALAYADMLSKIAGITVSESVATSLQVAQDHVALYVEKMKASGEIKPEHIREYERKHAERKAMMEGGSQPKRSGPSR